MKTYKFYGREKELANIKPLINKECKTSCDSNETSTIDKEVTYPGINNPYDLYDALCNIWRADTCAPRMRDKWTKENMTMGQCSITSFLVQDIFGGDVYGILREGGNYHCYNVIDGYVFDLTSEQFTGEILDYTNNPIQLRSVHFAKEEKYKRYLLLKNLLKEYCYK